MCNSKGPLAGTLKKGLSKGPKPWLLGSVGYYCEGPQGSRVSGSVVS